ncbi:hypothetical protein [Neobacillus sp. PS3-40]|uniref:hypothetical protein n=1 Tax=Neobacillus sp. PS3-40 TaxID=3070679 RepID=UPI0027E033DD|nr:hypothetical protein [Neobacillus sp. PS3-40]WML43960.1 hypothetical protein RCG20_19600 [Neobacillus sp. PS3-40]
MRKICVLLLFFCVILVACTNRTIDDSANLKINQGKPTTQEIPSKNNDANITVVEDILDTERFVQILKTKGYKVIKRENENGTTLDSLFSVYPAYYEVDEKRIGIYEYKNEKNAKKDSETISKDGSIIGHGIIDWVDNPHFYQRGKVLVSYIGSNYKLQNDLEGILGMSITN